MGQAPFYVVKHADGLYYTSSDTYNGVTCTIWHVRKLAARFDAPEEAESIAKANGACEVRKIEPYWVLRWDDADWGVRLYWNKLGDGSAEWYLSRKHAHHFNSAKEAAHVKRLHPWGKHVKIVRVDRESRSR